MNIKKDNDFITISKETNYYGIKLEWIEQSRVLEFNNINFNNKKDIEMDYKVDPDVKYVNEFDIVLVSDDGESDVVIGNILVLDISSENMINIHWSDKIGRSSEIDALIECISKQNAKQNNLLNRILYIKSVEIHPKFRGLELGTNIINLILETYKAVKNIEFSACILALGPSGAMSYPEYEDENNELSEESFKEIRVRLRRFYKRLGFVNWKTKNDFKFMIKNLKDRD